MPIRGLAPSSSHRTLGQVALAPVAGPAPLGFRQVTWAKAVAPSPNDNNNLREWRTAWAAAGARTVSPLQLAASSHMTLTDEFNMDIWFIRSNGETSHNNPQTKLYMPGEPPQYPERHFNHRNACLGGGFARVGWPASGDLRELRWRSRARDAYGPSLSSLHLSYLEQFAGIRVGDIVLIPADRERYEVHIGLVGRRATQPADAPRWGAYFYHYDVSEGDWYENAHRVSVQWHISPPGTPRVVTVAGLGGLWLKAFGRVESAKADVLDIMKHATFQSPAV